MKKGSRTCAMILITFNFIVFGKLMCDSSLKSNKVTLFISVVALVAAWAISLIWNIHQHMEYMHRSRDESKKPQ